MTNIYIFGLFAAAVISETIATLMIKESEQFSKFLPSAFSIGGYILSTYLLSVIVKTVPLGIAYAIWSACGIVLITIFGIWYGKEYMVSDIVTLLFVMVLYINIIKISLEAYIKAAGEFKSVKNSSIYQSVMNIILSLILVQKYGIGGVLTATVFAFITGNFIHYPRIISKKIINDKTINYYKKCLKYVIGLIINIVICYYINCLLYNANLFRWLINGIIIFTINLILTSIYYWLTKETKFIDRIKFMIKKYKESKAT